MRIRYDRREALAIRSASHALTFGDLESDGLGLRQRVPHAGIAELRSGDAAVVTAALASLDGWASEVRLTPPDLTTSTTDKAVSIIGSGENASNCSGSSRTQWVLFTSGTTGRPKAVAHTISSLTRTVSTSAASEFVWGLLYDPNRMAGLQVLLQGMSSGSAIIAPPLHDSLAERLKTFVEHGVNALSATPSLWRQIMQLPISHSLDLRQVTLGGEIADQRTLNALRSRFVSARMTHVFASTETGVAFSVKDGLTGFPLSYLTQPPNGIRLEIRDNVLFVRSPDVSEAGRDGFVSTGDIVEVVGERVIFRGRMTGVVNVGGVNVWPEMVESVLREHPDVLEAVVVAKPNVMTGNVLVASVTLTDTADRNGVNKRLRSWVRQFAPSTHVPASVTVLDEIQISSAGKMQR